MKFLHLIIALLMLELTSIAVCSTQELLVSVATEETDSHKRFVLSLKQFNYNYQVK
jgi:hypothetical protein